MRWYFPEHCERRTTSYFAFLPVRIDREVRWLERVRVRVEWDDDLRCWLEREFLD